MGFCEYVANAVIMSVWLHLVASAVDFVQAVVARE